MAKIHINNPKQVINGGAKKYYFKVKGLGGPKGDKGDKGDTGATGPQGPQGNAATVSIGSTTTLPVGYDATVTNSGSIYNAVLNFGIPQGPRGPQGATGAKGDKGDKGEQGNPGPQGEKGTNATVYVGTTSTLNPGSQATVYNSGTDNNAVLNFGIPKGEKGDTGPMPTIAQTIGQAIDQVMSQKATTDALNTKQATITNSNKLSADLVTDSTTTNKFVTAEDKTTWNAKQNALTAGQGIDITSDVISTPALVPEVVTELPTTGAEGKLYLTPKAHTTQTATGNPIEATITEQAGQLESFQLDGDTFQYSYDGGNLFNTTLENGTISSETGADSGSATNRLRTVGYIELVGGATTVTVETSSSKTLQLVPRYYSEDGTYLGYGLLNWQTSPLTVNLPSGTKKMRLIFRFSDDTAISSGQITSISITENPSPNPDFPQTIQTVTGEQTVTVASKNLFSRQNLTEDSRVSTSNGVTYDREGYEVSDYIEVEPSTNYALTCGNAQNGSYFSWYDSTKTYISGSGWQNKTSKTSPANASYIRFDFLASEVGIVQFEKGSTATAYAPYSKQTLPINLGTIELCELGTYKDYIWKDGEDWKVHKATIKAELNGTEDWQNSSSAATYPFYVANIFDKIGASVQAANAGEAYFSHFSITGRILGSNGYIGACLLVDNPISLANVRVRLSDMSSGLESFKTMLSNKKPVIYAKKATATDTTITDTTLIAQLEAIRTALLQNGANTITNTATGSNLAGDMEIGYYGYNPTNRYDKWLWLDINNEYEQIGS